MVSDIHANMAAFRAVLQDIRDLGVDRVISLGDNVGYGPEPEAVITALAEHDIPSVLGNHERALLNPDFCKGFNPKAREALEINRRILSRESLDRISEFPEFLCFETARFVHGVPPDLVDRYVHKESLNRLALIMDAQAETLSFVGHTHQLAVYGPVPGRIRVEKFQESRVFLAKTGKYIINSGSVGQPRSSHNKATYVIWDVAAQTIEARLVPYDASSTIRLIRERGIPEIYGELLLAGTMASATNPTPNPKT